MKANELLSLSKAQLEAKIKELKEELFNLRFQLATGQLQNIMVIKGVKRDIARCMTALRQLEQKDAQ
jgi:large subunit ribosomal protein L29